MKELQVIASDPQTLLITICFLTFAIWLYMLPWFIAWRRGANHLAIQFFLNLLINGTGIGWIIMLIVAFMGKSKADRLHEDLLLATIAKSNDTTTTTTTAS